VWLSVPEMLDWEGLAGFRYGFSRRSNLHSDIHALTFLNEIEDPSDLDDYMVKRRFHIYAVAADNDTIIRQWPVYRCLYAEVHDESQTYLLNNGRWFRIAADFVQRIDEAIERIPRQVAELPIYSDRSEGAYCKRIAEGWPTQFALMDQRLIRYPSLPTTVEFCDLYSSRDKRLIHLKRYSGSSALSHLFAQGVVSGRLVVSETEFRRAVNRRLPECHQLQNVDTGPAHLEYEVVYGIISKSQKKLSLPFFSRVNLKNAHSNLTSIGYRVSISKIDVQEQ
jgi:uncharacterized protein (TIGR04141 family)